MLNSKSQPRGTRRTRRGAGDCSVSHRRALHGHVVRQVCFEWNNNNKEKNLSRECGCAADRCFSEQSPAFPRVLRVLRVQLLQLNFEPAMKQTAEVLPALGSNDFRRGNVLRKRRDAEFLAKRCVRVFKVPREDLSGATEIRG